MKGRIVAPVVEESADPTGGDVSPGFEERSTHMALIESLTLYTGRMQPLPEWADSGVLLGLQARLAPRA